MRNRLLIGFSLIAVGILAAISPSTIFPICSSEKMGGIAACFYTARAEIGVGIIIALLGLFIILIKNNGILLGLSISAALNGIMVIALPTVLTGVCKSSHMSCKMLTLPALSVIGVITVLIAAAYSGYLYKVAHKGVHKHEQKTINDNTNFHI